MADEIGLEFMLPHGRGAGYGSETDDNITSFETIYMGRWKRTAGANGTYPIIGDPDSVVAQMHEISDIGISSIPMGVVNNLEDFASIKEAALAGLEKAGLRQENERKYR